MCFHSVRVVCVSSSYYHMCVHHVHVTVCLFFRSHVCNTQCVSSSAACCASCVCFFFSCVFLKCMSRGRPPPITWPPLSLLSASGSQLFSIWAVSSAILVGSNVSIALLECPIVAPQLRDNFSNIQLPMQVPLTPQSLTRSSRKCCRSVIHILPALPQNASAAFMLPGTRGKKTDRCNSPSQGDRSLHPLLLCKLFRRMK